MAFPSERAKRHVERLAERHDIEIHWVQWQWQSEAGMNTGQVWIPKPTTALKYLICLHEIGHIVDKVAARVLQFHGPEAEAAAWRWAVKAAHGDLLDHMTPAAWRKVGNAWITSVTRRAPSVS